MWSRQQLEQHSVDMRQFIDFRQSTLDNGMRIIEAYNSSGLTFTILPDRGLDIWQASYNGQSLTWIAQNSPFPPDFGLTWLRQFNGGLLTTCGLTHVGPPEADDLTGERRDLHGLYSRLRAADISISREWKDDQTYAAELRGVVCETALFGEQLRLERTYTLILGEPTIQIHDTIANIGDVSTPLMVLYHLNVGYPLVAAGTRLFTASETVVPRDAEAQKGFDRWPEYESGTPGYAEQVFFHRVKAGQDGASEALLSRGDFGLAFRWDTRALPYLTQWKNIRQGIYVSGVEPANCIPEGRNRARQSGRLAMIEAGERREFSVSMSALGRKEAVESCREHIGQLDVTGRAVQKCDLSGYPG